MHAHSTAYLESADGFLGDEGRGGRCDGCRCGSGGSCGRRNAAGRCSQASRLCTPDAKFDRQVVGCGWLFMPCNRVYVHRNIARRTEGRGGRAGRHPAVATRWVAHGSAIDLVDMSPATMIASINDLCSLLGSDRVCTD